jgi:hypothetical protein
MSHDKAASQMPVMMKRSDGWVHLHEMRGFRHHRIEAHVQDVNGSPRVTELRVVPVDGANPRVITDSMLRSLDLRMLAKWSRDVSDPERHDDLRHTTEQILKTRPPKKRVTVEVVARLWLAAHEAGLPDPRKQVILALARDGIELTERTISRYLARAREQGLIPEGRR